RGQGCVQRGATSAQHGDNVPSRRRISWRQNPRSSPRRPLPEITLIDERHARAFAREIIGTAQSYYATADDEDIGMFTHDGFYTRIDTSLPPRYFPAAYVQRRFLEASKSAQEREDVKPA